jgi:hypothetical protein
LFFILLKMRKALAVKRFGVSCFVKIGMFFLFELFVY